MKRHYDIEPDEFYAMPAWKRAFWRAGLQDDYDNGRIVRL